METTKETIVRDWYIATYPHDKLAQTLNPNITFKDVFERLDRGQCVYELFGVADSLIRENIFSELAIVMGVNYDYIYEQWLLFED